MLKKTDEDLLEPFKESLALPGKKLIVLHLIGSHPQACRRTNDRYTEFFKSQELSCYIESLKNTDQSISSHSVHLGTIKKGEAFHLSLL